MLQGREPADGHDTMRLLGHLPRPVCWCVAAAYGPPAGRLGIDTIRRHDGVVTLRQKQRVAFAAALVGRHNVVVLRRLRSLLPCSGEG